MITNININTMISILIIESNGNIKEVEFKKLDIADLYKKCNFRKSENFDKRTLWSKIKVDGKSWNIAVYSRNFGKAGTENKYDLPPPIDSQLYFGSMAIVSLEKDGDDNWVLGQLTKNTWEKIYEKLFGGFENLNATALEDEDEVDELDKIPAKYKTKGGYLKDGFVVSDDNSDDPSNVYPEGEELEIEEYDYLDDSEEEASASEAEAEEEDASASEAEAEEEESQTDVETETDESMSETESEQEKNNAETESAEEADAED